MSRGILSLLRPLIQRLSPSRVTSIRRPRAHKYLRIKEELVPGTLTEAYTPPGDTRIQLPSGFGVTRQGVLGSEATGVTHGVGSKALEMDLYRGDAEAVKFFVQRMGGQGIKDALAHVRGAYDPASKLVKMDVDRGYFLGKGEPGLSETDAEAVKKAARAVFRWFDSQGTPPTGMASKRVDMRRKPASREELIDQIGQAEIDANPELLKAIPDLGAINPTATTKIGEDAVRANPELLEKALKADHDIRAAEAGRASLSGVRRHAQIRRYDHTEKELLRRLIQSNLPHGKNIADVDDRLARYLRIQIEDALKKRRGYVPYRLEKKLDQLMSRDPLTDTVRMQEDPAKGIASLLPSKRMKELVEGMSLDALYDIGKSTKLLPRSSFFGDIRDVPEELIGKDWDYLKGLPMLGGLAGARYMSNALREDRGGG